MELTLKDCYYQNSFGTEQTKDIQPPSWRDQWVTVKARGPTSAWEAVDRGNEIPVYGIGIKILCIGNCVGLIQRTKLAGRLQGRNTSRDRQGENFRGVKRVSRKIRNWLVGLPEASARLLKHELVNRVLCNHRLVSKWCPEANKISVWAS